MREPRVRDIHGNEYLDGASGGVWCVNVGYGRESMARVVYDQLVRLPYYAGVAGTVPAAQFADRLAGLLPGLDRIYFSNSGSEANEKAFKMVRQIAHLNGDAKSKVLYRDRDYHGTTIACLAATGQPERKEEYGPFPEGFAGFPHALCYRCPFDLAYPDCNIECARVLEDVIQEEGPETVGAVIVEPITAGGGVIPPVDEYYPHPSGDLREIRRHSDHRRGRLRVRAYREDVRLRALRCGAGYRDHGQGHGQRLCADLGHGRSQRGLRQVLARPQRHVRLLPGHQYLRRLHGRLRRGLENLRILEDEQLIENARVVGDYLL